LGTEGGGFGAFFDVTYLPHNSALRAKNVYRLLRQVAMGKRDPIFQSELAEAAGTHSFELSSDRLFTA